VAVTLEERRALMSERLMALREMIMGYLIQRYGLSESNAEDVYGDTIEYMLRRGCLLVDMTRDFDAAIRSTAKRRAINSFRQNKWIKEDVVDKLQSRDQLLDTRDQVSEWDAEIDREVYRAHLKARATTPERHLIAKLFGEDRVWTEVADDHGMNRHTLHSSMRWARRTARKLCQART
jgi:hypothetical protein